ncbi:MULTISPECIES: hypothetical protein [Brevibacillus]|uniref:hypothetical protein n=1 Tax=Brevibacillus TaxID=55080 RepID=UPI000D113879|nr:MULTISPECIES: hypothetical protein [Brevibacillus]MED1946287.1 hypothetical protein [Brevibacillus formosus]MED1998791.1 hypothetical protein [Brevibacillus formosus]MED2084152.1 hypothetical protein [Brevibacillus formosus]PSK18187.1 hypothetical protein C7R94_13555 [Brevibacillus sp. NRRL NRS-603]
MKKAVFTAAIAVVLSVGQIVYPIQEAGAATAASYRIAYKMPTVNTLEEKEVFHFLLKGALKIKNPHPASILDKNRKSLTEIVGDLNGTDTPRGFMIDEFSVSKNGYLLALYNEIGILDPVYPQGYDPAAISKQILEQQASGQWGGELRRKRGEMELNARIKALVQAGYVQPEELKDQRLTKQFVAETLYRMYKKVRPYKGSVAPKDSQSEAVRWAVEVGVPGFQVDTKGYVYPESQPYYTNMLDFLHLFLPSKKMAAGWEYFQYEVNQDMLLEAVHNYSGQLLHVNNKPLSSLPNYVMLSDLPEKKKAETQLSASLAPKVLEMVEQVRREVQKPRVWDWRTDVIRHPSFTKLVSEYRKTKSQKALNQVYQTVKARYNLFDRQDSPQVMKSVLDHIR